MKYLLERLAWRPITFLLVLSALQGAQAYFNRAVNLPPRMDAHSLIIHMSGEINSALKDSYRATIGGRPILPLFTRGSA